MTDLPDQLQSLSQSPRGLNIRLCSLSVTLTHPRWRTHPKIITSDGDLPEILHKCKAFTVEAQKYDGHHPLFHLGGDPDDFDPEQYDNDSEGTESSDSESDLEEDSWNDDSRDSGYDYENGDNGDDTEDESHDEAA